MKKKIWKKWGFYLKTGLTGLKVSLVFLVIIVILMTSSVFSKTDSSEIISVFFKIPSGYDYLAIFGLSLLFIVVPFVTAIEIKKIIKNFLSGNPERNLWKF